MWDREAKARLGYTDPRTRVYFDGRERLYGKDWTKRKLEIWERGGGRCERIVGQHVIAKNGYSSITNEDVRCKSEMNDPHHIVARSKKRDDRASNLIGLCRMHHDLLDRRKVRSGKVGA